MDLDSIFFSYGHSFLPQYEHCQKKPKRSVLMNGKAGNGQDPVK